MNVSFKKQDYKKLRKADDKTLKGAMQVRLQSTEECIYKLVKEVANQYPDKQFEIEHDGIIKFSVKYENQVIYTGDHYDIEKMLEKGTYVFSNHLNQKIQELH